LNIIDGLEKYLESQNLESVEDIIGIL